MKIINAYPASRNAPMTEEETKNFMTNIDTNLLIRIGLIDEKGEPNVIPLAYYFDDMVLQVYTTD
jgi:nitroimidazol reductase NimA-like FMN-containing flavoprotein (pyridoxamine 5'-phosphate oxidase superfamily)